MKLLAERGKVLVKWRGAGDGRGTGNGRGKSGRRERKTKR